VEVNKRRPDKGGVAIVWGHTERIWADTTLRTLGGRMKVGRIRLMQIVAAMIGLGIVGVLVLSSLTSQAGTGPNAYTNRPTFYNLPAIIYSNSSHTEEIREHISYSTFNY
jgi:hypothetical protein